MAETIAALMRRQAEANPEKIFLYFGDQEISYRQLDQITNRVAQGLAAAGLSVGDKLCLMLPNCPEYLYLFLGAPKLGVTVVPINTALKQAEIAYIAENSEARAIVVNATFYPLAKNLVRASDNVKTIILVGDDNQTESVADKQTESVADKQTESVADQDDQGGREIRFAELLAADDRATDNGDQQAIVAIMYTSGTTGKPKGVMLSQANYLNNSAQAQASLGMPADERAMCILPLFHVNAQVATVLTPLQAGASLILTEGFSPKTFFQNLARYRATTFSGVPTVYSILLNLPDRDRYDLSSLRRCICGAAPMPVELFNQFEKVFNTIILEGYGLTEGTCVSTLNPIEGERKIGSIGKALIGQEVKIFDDQDQEVGVDQIGEIVVRGPNVMMGYYRNQTATAETLRNGWLHTGDLGRVDRDGYYYIEGRKKEMIIRGGENIYPKEIEEVLYRHAAIKEVAVVGMADRTWGEEVAAVVILKDGASASADDIIAFTRAQLADYKCPRQVLFCKEFPKTATGKVQKSKLVEQLSAELTDNSGGK